MGFLVVKLTPSAHELLSPIFIDCQYDTQWNTGQSNLESLTENKCSYFKWKIYS